MMKTTRTSTTVTVTILPNTTNNPSGKLADAELHFAEGPLTGLKLIGFGIWERRTGDGRNVTFPANTASPALLRCHHACLCGRSRRCSPATITTDQRSLWKSRGCFAQAIAKIRSPCGVSRD
jgi:hypothetical protein